MLYAVEKLAANAQNLTRSGSSACNVGWHKTCHIPHARCCHAASCIRYADSPQTAQARSSTVCSTRHLVIVVGRSYKWVAKDRDAARACAQRTRNGRWLLPQLCCHGPSLLSHFPRAPISGRWNIDAVVLVGKASQLRLLSRLLKRRRVPWSRHWHWRG